MPAIETPASGLTLTETAQNLPSLILSAYAEDLIVGARVAVFGDARLGLSDELVDRGARLVHVYDSDRARVAEATTQSRRRSVIFAELPESGDVGVRDGAFDFVFVPDLSQVGDAAGLLAVVKRILSPQGAALIASPNPECESPFMFARHPGGALGYYELYDVISATFARVRMIGQTPFTGYTVAEFSIEGEPDLSVDTSLTTSETKEPEWFVALASEKDVRLDPFAIIELPFTAVRPLEPALAPVAIAPAPTPAPARAVAPPSTPVEPHPSEAALLAAAKARALAESERAHAIEALEGAERRVADALETLRQREHEIALARTHAAEQAERVQGDARLLEKRARELTEVNRELAEANRELSDMKRELADAKRHLAQSEKECERLRAESEALRANPELASLRARAGDLDAALSKASQEREEEFSRLEVQLRERGHENATQRAELLRRKRLVRDLIAELEEERDATRADEEAGVEPPLPSPVEALAVTAPSSAPPPASLPEPRAYGAETAELREHLDRLAREAATREADLIASSWRIAQLERQLATRAREREQVPSELESEPPPRDSRGNDSHGRDSHENDGHDLIDPTRILELESALRNAHAERDALRQALAERVRSDRKADDPV